MQSFIEFIYIIYKYILYILYTIFYYIFNYIFKKYINWINLLFHDYLLKKLNVIIKNEK